MKELIKFWALSLFFIGCFVSWYWYSRPVRSQDDETNKPIVQKQTRPNLIWPYWATMVRLMSRGKKIDTMVYFCASVLQNEIEKMTSSCSSVRLWVQFRVSSGCSGRAHASWFTDCGFESCQVLLCLSFIGRVGRVPYIRSLKEVHFYLWCENLLLRNLCLAVLVLPWGETCLISLDLVNKNWFSLDSKK